MRRLLSIGTASLPNGVAVRPRREAHADDTA